MASDTPNELDHTQILTDFERLFQTSFDLSASLSGFKTEERRLAIASVIFFKIVLNAASVLKIYPSSKYFNRKLDTWDISSVASLVRNLIECSNILYYLSIEKIDTAEVEFRFRLYALHACSELLATVKSMGGANEKIDDLKDDCSKWARIFEADNFFQSIPADDRKRLLKGKRGFFLTQKQMTERRGIEVGFFEGAYKFLSAHTHTAPHSIEQIIILNTGDNGKDSMQVFLTLILNHGCHYLARTIVEVAMLFDKKITDDDFVFVSEYSNALST